MTCAFSDAIGQFPVNDNSQGASGWIRSFGRARECVGRGKAAIKVRKYIVDMLYADREADVIIRNAGCKPILGRQLRMCRCRRMDGKTARVADIGDVVEELQPVDEAPACLAPACQFEADKAAVSAAEIFVGALSVRAALL